MFKRLEITDKSLMVLIYFHEEMKAVVVFDEDFSESINVTSGTKEGCVIGPVLFTLLVKVMLK